MNFQDDKNCYEFYSYVLKRNNYFRNKFFGINPSYGTSKIYKAGLGYNPRTYGRIVRYKPWPICNG